jgi:hypothetical protein
MMRQTLDFINGMGHRQTSAETMLVDLRDQSKATTTSICDAMTRIDNLVRHVDSLEAPQATVITGHVDPSEVPWVAVTTGPNLGPGILGAVPPSSTPMQPITRALDLNLAPSMSSRSIVVDAERPMGYGEHYGEFQGAQPQYCNEGTSMDSQLHVDASLHPPPFPNLEFPNFDGSNPRLWQDHCTMYFEVYDMHATLKMRFTALNFVGIAKTWLHTVEHRECITDWQTLCKLVMAHFDKD